MSSKSPKWSLACVARVVGGEPIVTYHSDLKAEVILLQVLRARVTTRSYSELSYL